ncbi:hypothetical protein PIB30_062291 [Stylosanthes scabra]|uniref:Uncharacterized protein n=1 Tax=Stylosanthes scabra TaxID=79078 RepID=A0ABU6ULM1_9FABA|nr:hypothetical protein [Stylosanthes scabra]
MALRRRHERRQRKNGGRTRSANVNGKTKYEQIQREEKVNGDGTRLLAHLRRFHRATVIRLVRVLRPWNQYPDQWRSGLIGLDPIIPNYPSGTVPDIIGSGWFLSGNWVPVTLEHPCFYTLL